MFQGSDRTVDPRQIPKRRVLPPEQAGLHQRLHGRLPDEARQRRQQVPLEKIRAVGGGKYVEVFRPREQIPEGRSQSVRVERRLRAGEDGLRHLSSADVLEVRHHQTHIRLSRRRRGHHELVHGNKVRQVAQTAGGVSVGERGRPFGLPDGGFRQRGVAVEDGTQDERRLQEEVVHVGQQEADVPRRAPGRASQRGNFLG